ncbi:uncharacterized protein LOC130732240 [Lotus japonicus]|uniref:uncharacterized protein LOC130732240 n=1 Tax=Lotus japonicus TaxID=34305 RepID=UPI00258743D4|nr:uncharacterized protein LOC130732240 [Lotus japonicus]
MTRASSSGSRCSSKLEVRRGMVQRGVCECGERLLYLTSHTDINPERNFWRCRNWKLPNNCGFFLWDDEAGLDGAQRYYVVQLMKTLQELEESKKKLEDRKRRVEEMKKKNVNLYM